ncbi:hypothetical protein CPB86DRAFT_781388 [Serendipita vermifera]|nr:hypothetical protein CPB86DRAFT_781388 [Serendipita vermifera]
MNEETSDLQIEFASATLKPSLRDKWRFPGRIMKSPHKAPNTRHEGCPIIMITGMTGSGKSTFITRIVGKDLGIVVDGLRSGTLDIQEFPVNYKGRDIVLVDTPSFDSISDLSDEVILRRFVRWLERKLVVFQHKEALIY